MKHVKNLMPLVILFGLTSCSIPELVIPNFSSETQTQATLPYSF